MTSFSFSQENHETDARMTNDDVLGDEIPTDQQDAFRQFCYQTLKLVGGVSLLNGCHVCLSLLLRFENLVWELWCFSFNNFTGIFPFLFNYTAIKELMERILLVATLSSGYVFICHLLGYRACYLMCLDVS